MYCQVLTREALKLLLNGFISWHRQVMEEDKGNLIDFGDNHTENTTTNLNSSISIESPSENDNIAPETLSLSVPSSETSIGLTKGGKSNKSLFEITRVDPARGESGDHAGDNDSEFDDTFPESQEQLVLDDTEKLRGRSSTSISESVVPSEDEHLSNSISTDDVEHSDVKPLTVTVDSQQAPVSETASSTSSTPPVSTTTTCSNSNEPATSRFRIVKISKQKPYEKGKWTVNDFQEKGDGSAKQSSDSASSSDVPPSPFSGRRTNTSTYYKHSSESSGGDQKSEKKVLSSPTNTVEPNKQNSSEMFANVISSRGCSYHTNGEGRRSQDRVLRGVSEDAATKADAMNQALDRAHSAKESLLQVFVDEMRRLRGSITCLHTDNITLKAENEALRKLYQENECLKKKIAQLEHQLHNQSSIDKG